MKNVKNLLNVLVISLILSSCEHYTPPISELCILGDDGGVCIDERLPKDEQEYFLAQPDMLNYVCTNPADYDAQFNWWYDKLKRLEKCESNPKSCGKEKQK